MSCLGKILVMRCKARTLCQYFQLYAPQLLLALAYHWLGAVTIATRSGRDAIRGAFTLAASGVAGVFGSVAIAAVVVKVMTATDRAHKGGLGPAIDDDDNGQPDAHIVWDHPHHSGWHQGAAGAPLVHPASWSGMPVIHNATALNHRISH